MTTTTEKVIGSFEAGGKTYDVVVREQPDPTTPPVPGPGRRRISWHYGWGGPPVGTWPVDVTASCTDVVFAMAQSAKAGTGILRDPPGVTRQEVMALVADGVGAHVGIGGAGDGGITVDTSARAHELVTSVLSMRDRFGYTGAWWDLESDPNTRWNPTSVVEASRLLISSGMRIGIWSALYGGRLEAWGSVAKALGAELLGWERGFYDFPEANDSRLTGVVTSDLPKMRGYVLRDDQLIASFAPVGSDSRTPIPIMSAAYAAARQVVRPGSSPAEKMTNVGWSVWADKFDVGYAAVRALKQM